MKRTILLLLLTLTAAQFVSAEITIADYDPLPAEAGEYVDVWVRYTSEKQDDSAPDLVMDIQPRDGLQLAEGEPGIYTMGNVRRGNSFLNQVRIKIDELAFEGRHLLDVLVYPESNPADAEKAELFLVVDDKNFEVPELLIGDIDSEPRQLKPDDENVRITFTIQNLGDGDAEGTSVKIVELPEGFSFVNAYDDIELVGEVPADDSAEADFYIDIDEDVQAGTYEIPMEARYKYNPDPDEPDDYLISTVYFNGYLRVKETPIFTVTNVRFEPGEMYPGLNSVLAYVEITNTGSDEAEYVRATVFPKTEQPFVFQQSSDFAAAKLDVGESTTVIFDFDIEADAPLNTYNMDLEVTSVLEDDVFSLTRSFNIPLTSDGPGKGFPIFTILLVAAGLIVVVVLVRRYRKKPKKR